MPASESGHDRPGSRTPEELHSQLGFLEDEVTELRRRLAEGPVHSRAIEQRLAETQRSLAAVTNYPGTVYFEGTNLTEGRGTDRPFEQIGAPWLNAPAVARTMNDAKLPGIRFEPTALSVSERRTRR